MKKNINEILKRKYENTKTNKIPEVNDIWLAYYPFMETGNMEKARPVLILEDKEDGNYLVQKITSNKEKGKLIRNKHLKKKSYLTDECFIINYEKMIRRLKSHNDKN